MKNALSNVQSEKEIKMPLTKEQIAQRIAKELQDGYYINLGIGIPTLVANYIPEGVEVMLQSENGLLGIGPFPYEGEEDADLINAGKQTITTIPGSAFFDSAMSFLYGLSVVLQYCHGWYNLRGWR